MHPNMNSPAAISARKEACLIILVSYNFNNCSKLINFGENMKNNIHISRDINDIFPLIQERKVIMVADEYFRSHDSSLDAIDCPRLWICADEEKKTLDTVGGLIDSLLEYGADRDTLILAAGGGITTDIAGFTASIYKRGVALGSVPTTLLAQVDASIGGKNGVNVNHFKNMVGVIRQPEFVFINPDFNGTLPVREYRCGIAEMLKMFCIADRNSFFGLLQHKDDVSEELIRRAIDVKTDIVEQDEMEHGMRRVLNLGHTFGHAIEKCSRDYLHGEAVSVGLVLAGQVSVSLGAMPYEELSLLRESLRSAGLPIGADICFDDLREAILQDKKSVGSLIDFALPLKIGDVRLRRLSMEQLEDGYNLL